ncbi:MAG: SpoIIE family protein phosphatase [Gammaproteobacteria bacterium]
MQLLNRDDLDILIVTVPDTAPETADRTWIRQASSRGDSLMGYQVNDLLSKPLTAICPEPVSEIWNAAWRSWRLGGGATHTIRCMTRQGTIQPWEATFYKMCGTEVAVLLTDFEANDRRPAPMHPDNTAEAGEVPKPENAIVTLDDEKRIIEWNQQAEALFGWSRLNALGQTFPDFLLPAAAFAVQNQDPIGYPLLDAQRALQQADEIPACLCKEPVSDSIVNQAIEPVIDIAPNQQGDTVSMAPDLQVDSLRSVAEIQKSMLPREVIENRDFQVCAYLAPEAMAAGVFIDYFSRRAGFLEMFILDTSKRSHDATLRMLEIRSILRAHANSPAQALTVLDEFLSDTLSQSAYHISMTYLEYNAHKQQLRYANAGHYPGLLCRRTKGLGQDLIAQGSPFGTSPKLVYEENMLHINSGDSVLLFSNALLQQNNFAGEPFGSERLSNLLSQFGKQHASQILNELVAELKRHAANADLDNDVAALVFKRT